MSDIWLAADMRVLFGQTRSIFELRYSVKKVSKVILSSMMHLFPINKVHMKVGKRDRRY